jgi:hypothetical protein
MSEMWSNAKPSPCESSDLVVKGGREELSALLDPIVQSSESTLAIHIHPRGLVRFAEI